MRVEWVPGHLQLHRGGSAAECSDCGSVLSAVADQLKSLLRCLPKGLEDRAGGVRGSSGTSQGRRQAPGTPLACPASCPSASQLFPLSLLWSKVSRRPKEWATILLSSGDHCLGATLAAQGLPLDVWARLHGCQRISGAEPAAGGGVGLSGRAPPSAPKGRGLLRCPSLSPVLGLGDKCGCLPSYFYCCLWLTGSGTCPVGRVRALPWPWLREASMQLHPRGTKMGEAQNQPRCRYHVTESRFK